MRAAVAAVTVAVATQPHAAHAFVVRPPPSCAARIATCVRHDCSSRQHRQHAVMMTDDGAGHGGGKRAALRRLLIGSASEQRQGGLLPRRLRRAAAGVLAGMAIRTALVPRVAHAAPASATAERRVDVSRWFAVRSCGDEIFNFEVVHAYKYRVCIRRTCVARHQLIKGHCIQCAIAWQCCVVWSYGEPHVARVVVLVVTHPQIPSCQAAEAAVTPSAHARSPACYDTVRCHCPIARPLASLSTFYSLTTPTCGMTTLT